VASTLDGLRDERRTGAEALSEGRVVYERRVADVQVDELEVRRKRQEAEQLGGEVAALEVKLERLAGARQHLVEGIAERYRVELHREIGEYHLRPEVGPAEEERLAELRGLIERMGADINLTAIEEFNEINQRFEFLSTQKIDLENALGQLERAIAKINKTSRTLFQETFDAVNAKFQEVFPRLFRGGSAYLSLAGADGDVLEAGVEIYAHPPGKKNSTVDQLSGGEKALTAVALLFAIFLIKPSPFCLLDEVDAPLDEANVDRYNLAIREMTDRSQFIVISHNKRTMETCDRLYGVTMQEPGVSKLVQVNLAKLGSSVAA
jgi:chromosome segregation protein